MPPVDLAAAAAAATEHLLATEEIMMIARYSWARDVDEDSLDLNDDETRVDFEEYVSRYASERVDEALEELCWSIDEDDGMVSIWRALTVPADFLENGIHQRPLGIYWSFREDAAESHWGDFGDARREIVLHGTVRIEDIDWQTSVELNAHSEEEKEIRLKPTAIVHVVSAAWSAAPPKDPARTVLLGADFAAGKTSDESCHSNQMMFA